MATIACGSASAPSVVLLHGFLGDRRDQAIEVLSRAYCGTEETPPDVSIADLWIE